MTVSVYLGSSIHCDKKYNVLACELGHAMAECGYDIVYGGSNVGTMKDLADGAMAAGGRVTGVFPRSFRGSRDIWGAGIEVQRRDLTEIIEVADFAERKKLMEELGDCCVVLPGSFGTLDEMFTYACDRSIDKHTKNIYVLNHEGYYDPVVQLIANMSDSGFLKPHLRNMFTFCATLDELMKNLRILSETLAK